MGRTFRNRLVLTGVLLLAGVILLLPEALPEDIRSGSPAPDFTLEDLNGKEVSLSDFKGKIVVVAFWATYCKACRDEIKDLNAYYKKYQNKDAVLLSVSMDKMPVDKLQEFADFWKITYPILIATRHMLSEWRVRAIPITYIVDGEGRIARCLIGPGGTGFLDAYTQKLLHQ